MRRASRRAPAALRTLALPALASLVLLGGCSGQEVEDPGTAPGSANGSANGSVAPVLGGVAWSWRDSGLDEIERLSVSEQAVVAFGTRGTTAVLSATSRDGEQLWEHDEDWFERETRGRLESGVVAGTGTDAAAALRVSNGIILGLDLADGSRAWTWESRRQLHTTVVGAADDTLLVREDPRFTCQSGRSRIVALDLVDGSELWDATAACDLTIRDERIVLGGDVVDPRTGEVLVSRAGVVCGVAGDVAVWLAECPAPAGPGFEVTGTPVLASLEDSSVADLPSFPRGEVLQVRSGPGVLAVTYLLEGPAAETRSWVGDGTVLTTEGRPDGALVASDGSFFELSVEQDELVVRDPSGAVAQRVGLPAQDLPADGFVQVEGVGDDHVLVTPARAGIGHLLLDLSTS